MLGTYSMSRGLGTGTPGCNTAKPRSHTLHDKRGGRSQATWNAGRLTFNRTVLALIRAIAWGLADPSSHASALVARPIFHPASETRKQKSTSST